MRFNGNALAGAIAYTETLTATVLLSSCFKVTVGPGRSIDISIFSNNLVKSLFLDIMSTFHCGLTGCIIVWSHKLNGIIFLA